MKTLLLTLLIAVSPIAKAQNWEFKLINTNTIVTNTIQVQGIFNTSPLYFDFLFKNISNDSLGAILSRKIIVAPGGGPWPEIASYGNASGGITHDLDGVGPNWTSFYNHFVAPNEESLASIIINSDPTQVPATYRYYFGVQGDLYQDSVDLVFQSTLSILETKKDHITSVSPNPASNNVKIQVSNFVKGNIKIVDVLGNVIKNETFSGSKTFNVAEFRNGVYFIIISGDEAQTINRKLVVRH